MFRSFLFDFFLNLGREMNENGGDVSAAFSDAYAQAWAQDVAGIVGNSGWSPGAVQDFNGSGA